MHMQFSPTRWRILLTPLALIPWRGGGRHKSSQLHTVSHQSIFSWHCTKWNNLVTPPSFHVCLFKRPDDVLCMSNTLLSLWGTRGLWHFYLGTLRWWESCACMQSNYCGHLWSSSATHYKWLNTVIMASIFMSILGSNMELLLISELN